MLQFLPQSVFSWNFDITGAQHNGRLTFNWFSEQGTITYAGQAFDVVKHGIGSGHWTLEAAGEILCDAQKTNPFFRSFTVREAKGEWLLQAQSPLTRCYNLSNASGGIMGTICPLHPFTRTSRFDCDASVPETTQIFCFWLAALTWKRAQKKN